MTNRLGLPEVRRAYLKYWRQNLWQKFIVIVASAILVSGISMYGIALWYQHSQVGKPVKLGVTYIADYAESLGLNSKQTFIAILDDLNVKQLRLVSYWSDIESTQGTYDFTQLDWQFQQAKSHGAVVSLAIGLRQPRWPECHIPSWASNESVNVWQPQLEQFMVAVINRYKAYPNLVSYQLENEFFNAFGDCTNFDRSRLASELALVKKLDSSHPVIISRSDNYAGFSLRQPLPDEIGISVYRRVWDAQISHRYAQYPFPSWYYGFLAGTQKLLTGKDSIIHELQAEPWPPNGKNITDISLAEQNKSFDAKQLTERVKFAENTGIKTIDLWGAEYWYYRSTVLHDPSVWTAAKQVFSDTALNN